MDSVVGIIADKSFCTGIHARCYAIAETLFAEPQGKSDARIFTVTVSRVTHRQFCHDKNHLHDTTVVPLHPSSLRRALK